MVDVGAHAGGEEQALGDDLDRALDEGAGLDAVAAAAQFAERVGLIAAGLGREVAGGEARDLAVDAGLQAKALPARAQVGAPGERDLVHRRAEGLELVEAADQRHLGLDAADAVAIAQLHAVEVEPLLRDGRRHRRAHRVGGAPGVGLHREEVVGAEHLERERLPVGAELKVPVGQIDARVERVHQERRPAVVAGGLDGDAARQAGLDERR